MTRKEAEILVDDLCTATLNITLQSGIEQLHEYRMARAKVIDALAKCAIAAVEESRD
jgi:hypothetical protein